jgi:hypothetical protein
VLDGFNDVSGTGLALSTDHSGTFSNTTEGLAQVAATTDERNLVVVLLHVVDIVGWGKDFGLVDIVNANGFEDLTITTCQLLCRLATGERPPYLALNKVSDTSLGHDRNGDSSHDLLDHAGVRHAGNTTLGSDVGGDSLQGHHGSGPGLLRNAGLLWKSH